jgi:hypothetical protein
MTTLPPKLQAFANALVAAARSNDELEVIRMRLFEQFGEKFVTLWFERLFEEKQRQLRQ